MASRVLLLLVLVQGLWANVHVMKDITLGFGEVMEQCREESQLTEDKMEEFFHLWHEDFKFEYREFGCALECMSNHFNLLSPGSKVHYGNTEEYIKTFPNGELIASKLVTIIRDCEHQFTDEEDHCWRFLHMAECATHKCVEEGLAPTMELMMAEFIMEAMN